MRWPVGRCLPAKANEPRLPKEYTVSYSVPGITFCLKRVHLEKVAIQELGDQSREE